MYSCPNCSRPLSVSRSPHGVFYSCAGCGGRAATIYALRRDLVEGPVDELWRAAHEGKIVSGRACPGCRQPMALAKARPGVSPIEVDVCAHCQWIWFDPGEYEAMPAAPADSAAPSAAPVRELVDFVPPAAAAPASAPAAAPVDSFLSEIFGFPFLADAPPRSHRPLLTWALVAATTAASVAAFHLPREAAMACAFVPAQALRLGGATFLTSFFLHGGYLHLFGNMYFLKVFGERVEDCLGRPVYALLLAAATAFGNAAHALSTRTPGIPCVGASGGIAGVLLFYAAAFPFSRLALVRFGRRFEFDAWKAAGVWLALQIIGVGAMSRGGSGAVAHMAHLGGAAIGVLFYLAWYTTVPSLGAR